MLAPWRSPLARAQHRNRSSPSARFAQLATIRPDGCPANRTVVLRGFCPWGDGLEMIADARSAKVTDILNTPAAELCWYFAKTREQFRFSGDLELVTEHTQLSQHQGERQRVWQSLSDAARLQFTWPTPGRQRDLAQEFPTLLPDPHQPPATFCLLVLIPWRVEHLELRGEPQNRWLYQLQTQTQTWCSQAINP